MRKFTKEFLGRLVVGVSRCSGRRKSAQPNLTAFGAQRRTPFLSFRVPPNALECCSFVWSLTAIVFVLTGSASAKVRFSIIQLVVIAVIYFFCALAFKYHAMHQKVFFFWRRSGALSPERAIRRSTSLPTPLIDPVKIVGVHDSVLTLRQWYESVRLIKRLDDRVTFHSVFHRSSWKGLLKFNRYFITAAVLLFALAVPSYPQNPSVLQANCQIGFSFTAPGRSTTFQNITPAGVPTRACTSWTMVYSSTGFAALSIEIDSAPDGGATPGVSPGSWTVWPAGQVAAGQVLPSTSITSAGITAFGFFPWVSVNLNSATGTGTVTGFLYGWQTQGSQESNTGATQVQGISSSGKPPSGNPVLVAYFDGTNVQSAPYCPNTSTFSVASTVTQVVAISGTTKVRVCSFSLNPSTITAGSVDIVYGTGANCGTGTTTLSGAYTLPASAVVAIGSPASMGFGPLTTPAGQAVCVRTVTSTVAGFITWTQF